MYKLPKEVRDAILIYFSNRPYKEVFEGIKALEALEEIKDEKKDH